MPLFNDRRNTNPATDIADYNDSRTATWRDDSGKPVKQTKTTGAVKGYSVPAGSTYGTKAQSDRSQVYSGLTDRAGRGDAAKDPSSPMGQDYYSRKSGYQADAAYANSWIKKGEVASDKARISKAKIVETKAKPQYTTPGGLVLNEMKKSKKTK